MAGFHVAHLVCESDGCGGEIVGTRGQTLPALRRYAEANGWSSDPFDRCDACVRYDVRHGTYATMPGSVAATGLATPEVKREES